MVLHILFYIFINTTMLGWEGLDLSKLFSKEDLSHFLQLSEAGQKRILNALQTEKQLKIKENGSYDNHDETTEDLEKNPENMSEKELEERIIGLLKTEYYEDLKNRLWECEEFVRPKYRSPTDSYNICFGGLLLTIFDDLNKGLMYHIEIKLIGNKGKKGELKKLYKLLTGKNQDKKES